MLSDKLNKFVLDQKICDSDQDNNSLFIAAINGLQQGACCSRCILRFMGCTDFSLYGPSNKILEQAFDSAFPPTSKIQVPLCSVCLGTLQFAEQDEIIGPIVNVFEKKPYDTRSYCLSFTPPISVMTRERLMYFHLQQWLQTHVPELAQKWEDIITIDSKEPMRYLVSQQFTALSDRVFEPSSPLRITVVLEHAPSSDEHLFLTSTKKQLLVVRKVRKKGITKIVGTSRPVVAEALKNLEAEEARVLTTVPPVPSSEKCTVKINTLHEAGYTGGRYLKFSRECSQTPWCVRGKKLAEISVSECIVDVLQKHHQCQAVKFTTAGREDANVRMLGTGRPFYCELVDPVRPVLPAEEYAQMEAEINESSTKDVVQVRHICPIQLKDTNLIKAGEEFKRKTYQALIWVSSSVTDEMVKKCNDFGRQGFEISQHTPVRVSQRRAMMERSKQIHELSMVKVSDKEEDARFAVITMNTQAGTYIKEFVHGDLQRSLPNMASILGVEAADLLELDVTNVDLVWPPQSN
ncbi:hypothetical protein DM01DRAFT_1409781 [Hesseltinella vesiculosa]|uniref:tRNA pseudouridine(55) synthase n=1 Tax=Hesseltinella vesiculosa TaxID=101127 RepID=A0A1X2G9H1_9FUNG|nr:hypothetical protein DM01DRAFT_1409781 [Hesseltinella vesiculosa]